MADVTATPWDLDTYKKRYGEAIEMAKRERENFQRAQRLATILYDLDRCQHGRHEGDVCSGESGCNGPSKGNPHVKTGDVIGYTIDRKPITMPERGRRHDPDAWVPGGQR